MAPLRDRVAPGLIARLKASEQTKHYTYFSTTEKEKKVDDWRYDFLKDEIKRLREDLSEVLGVWAAEIADAAGAF